jgi:hypothetical protein
MIHEEPENVSSNGMSSEALSFNIKVNPILAGDEVDEPCVNSNREALL